MKLQGKHSYVAVCMHYKTCSTAHLEVHSADLGVQIDKTLCKLIFACNACLYCIASHCIVTIYYCGDAVHAEAVCSKIPFLFCQRIKANDYFLSVSLV